MSTVHLKFGPADHGRAASDDDFESAEYEPGFKYEVIDGRLYVAPIAGLPESFLERWLRRKLEAYADARPDVIAYLTPKPRVFVPGRKRTTAPESDLGAYQDFPRDTPVRELSWRDVSPLLVVEVLVEGDAQKDLTRNPELYLAVPSIREYWVLDGRDDADEPTLIQYRRYGKRWVVRSFPYGSTFTTKLLPGFTLPVDPRK